MANNDVIRLLVLYYGGTFGLMVDESDEQIILRGPRTRDEALKAWRQIERYLRELEERFFRLHGIPKGTLEFDFVNVTLRDSNNLELHHRERLFHMLNMVQNPWSVPQYKDHEDLRLRDFAEANKQYDGVLVITGTDRLPEESSAIVLGHFGALRVNSAKKSFPAPNVPVVITGAQANRLDEAGDAATNVIRSWRVLRGLIHERLSAILTVFGERIALAGQGWKNEPGKWDAFRAQTGAQVGYFDPSGILLFSSRLIPPRPQRKRKLIFKAADASPVWTVPLEHFMKPSRLEHDAASADCSALLLIPSGPGNGCDEGMFNLIPTLEKLRRQGFPVFLWDPVDSAAVDSGHTTAYEPGQSLASVTIPVTGMTRHAARQLIAWLMEHQEGLKGPRDWERKLNKKAYGLSARSDRIAI